MKALAIALAGTAVIMSAVPARADNARLTTILNGTTEDYKTLTSCLMSAKGQETLYWGDYKKEVEGVVSRVAARRKALADLDRDGADGLPPAKRGLIKMLIHDLDDINLSMLALVMDERGLTGYLKTGDEGLVAGIDNWREGIRLAIGQTRRSIKLAGSVNVPLLIPPRLVPVPDH